MGSHQTGRAERTALLALVITCAMAAAKVAVWALTGSLAILSQALDSIVDVVALGLVFVAVRIAAKPADRTHHYGHAKAENLVAFAQTTLLTLVVLAVVYEAFARLTGASPAQVGAPWYAFALLATSAFVDGNRVRLVARAARAERSEALSAGALNLATDLGTAIAALASLAGVKAGFEQADAIGGLLVAAAVAVATFRLGKRSVDVLMDRAPLAPVEAIAAAAERIPGVAETRRVRVRGGEKQIFADVTVAAGRTSSLERAHDIAEDVEREIARVAPGADVVVHVEPVAEVGGLVERVQAAASRIEGIHQVHNVSVHSLDHDGLPVLRVTLHAKVDPYTSLQKAHDLSERVEEAVRSELGPEAHVHSHIEPLELTDAGRDVTATREDLVTAVGRAALQEPEVLDCREVLITTSSDSHTSVVAHVLGRGDLPLERIHAASERIEKRVQADHPEVGSVLMRFEPAP
jgi:cation diffusion facilitator family transporter